MDIVESLRGVRRNGSWNLLKPRGNEAHPICHKAATEIETLRTNLTAAQAEIEVLKAERDKLAAIVQGWHYLAVGPDEMGDYYTHKQLVKASEPYASPALKALSERQP